MNNPDATQIAKLGIKLFSVSPSEMCDERTASKMAAWSTAKRNGLGPDNIINMGILEKYWKYGFSTSNIYTHTSCLSLDTLDGTTPPPTKIPPAPTLQDLLNPIPLTPNPSEATLFNNPDPYGQAALEEDESDEEGTDGLPAVIIRSSDARRLAIEQYINLEAPALLARLDPGSAKPTGSTSAASSPASTQKPKWTAQSTARGKDDGGW
ncbi:hypothetical protein C8R44DRAFT_885404 [Mycena epipterygia]|nr:hypothetical protein C8R44DRAFT_885404 [Mycena epipterygia]